MSGINIYTRKESSHVSVEDVTDQKYENAGSPSQWISRIQLVKVPVAGIYVGICDETAGCGAGKRQTLVGVYGSREKAIRGESRPMAGWTGASIHSEKISLGTPYKRFSWPMAEVAWKLEASLAPTRLVVDLGFEAVVNTENKKQMDLYKKLKSSCTGPINKPVLDSAK